MTRPRRERYNGEAILIIGRRTLGTALEDKARRFPDQAALVFEDSDGTVSSSLTWRDLDRLVNQAAHFLLRRGLKPGERFNLHLGNCPEFLVQVKHLF